MQTCSPTTDTEYACTVIHTTWKCALYSLPVLDGHGYAPPTTVLAQTSLKWQANILGVLTVLCKYASLCSLTHTSTSTDENKCTQICVTGREKLCPCPSPPSTHQCTKIHKHWCSPPPSCAVTQKHTSDPSACAQAYTNTELHTHAHTQTVQSLKWRKKSHFPLVVPTNSDHRPIGGFHRHKVFLFFSLQGD